MARIEQVLAEAVTAVYGFKSGEKGQGMAEYGLILALVAVVVIVALTALGGKINDTFNSLVGAF